jgi:hypothetical protein
MLNPNQQPKSDGGFDWINLKLFQQGIRAHMGLAKGFEKKNNKRNSWR